MSAVIVSQVKQACSWKREFGSSKTVLLNVVFDLDTLKEENLGQAKPDVLFTDSAPKFAL